ncbi:MAG: hypothetical protein ACI81V_000157 [Lentimonas sp.]|jgi:hypothetical protein
MVGSVLAVVVASGVRPMSAGYNLHSNLECIAAGLDAGWHDFS